MLGLVALFTVLTSVQSVKVSGEDFFYMFGANNRQDPTFKGINFTQGTWFETWEQSGNPDNRMLEFHSDNVAFAAFNTHKADETERVFLNAPSRVLIFYVDKNPAFGPSFAKQMGVEGIRVLDGEITLEMDYIARTYGDVFTLSNNIPLLKMGEYIEKSKRLYQFQMYLGNYIDPTDANKFKALYKLPDDSSTQEAFESDIIRVIMDMGIMKNYDVLTNVNYLTEVETRELKDFSETREQILTDLLVVLKETTVLRNKLNKFIAELEFVAHKLLRDFFYGDSFDFIRELFKNFDEETSSLESLMESNIAGMNIDYIINLRRMSMLKADPTIEINKSIFPNASSYQDETAIEKYNHYKRHDLMDAFVELFKEFEPKFPEDIHYEFLGGIRTKENIDKMSNFTVFLDIYKRHYFPNLFELYQKLVFEGLTKISLLKQLKFTNIAEGADLVRFRNEMLGFGFVNFDPNVDQKNVVYKEAEIFTPGDRLLVI